MYGNVRKSLGYRGELGISVEGKIPEKLSVFRFFHLDLEGGLVPFAIEEVAHQGNQSLKVKFLDVPSEEKAKRLINCKVYLERKEFAGLGKGNILEEQVEGYEVVDKKNGVVGIVTGYWRRQGQDLLEVEKEGREVLIPVVPAMIVKVDEKKKVIYVDLPAGLTTLNE